MLKKNTVDMLSGPITKGLLSMTLPIMLMNILQNLFNVIDMMALGKFASDQAVGSVGACTMLIALCSCLLTGTSTGANVVVARHIGEGDREKTEIATGTSILFSLMGGVVLSAIGLVFAEIFLRWTNCPEDLLPNSILYFRIYFLGVPAILFYSFCASILRATGDTRRPMIFSITGGVIKVVLTIGFIVLFDMGIAGVAVATIISNAVSGILCYYTIAKGNDKTTVSLKQLSVDFNELKAMLRVGIPTGLQTGLHSFANVIITATVNSFGADAATGVSIANQFDVILYNISYAPAIATIPYVSQNIGAGNVKRAKQCVVKANLIAVAFGATLGVLVAIFSGPLSATMTSSKAVISFSQQRLILVSLTYFICGINEIIGGALRGMGRPMTPTVATLIFMCAFRFVWVYAIFPLFPHLTFLYLVWPIGWVLSISTMLFVYYPTMRKLEQQFAASKAIEV